MSKSRDRGFSAALVAGLACLPLPVLAETLGLGRPALPEEIAAWDMTVLPDGQGLRPGSGSVDDGEDAFVMACAACHGDFAEGIDSWPALSGGMGSLTDPRPLKTVGSYWPYLSTVWDYVHRSMPFGGAQTLTTDEVYAITAYILYSNDLVDADFVLTHENFAEIVLPNVDGFYADDRPEVEYPLFSVEPCMQDCGPPVEVIARASDLGVTPMDDDGRPAGTLPMLFADAGAAMASGDAAGEEAATAAETDDAPAEPAPEAASDPAPDPELVAEGERAFRQCSACHAVGDGARNGVGPALNGIVGHPAGSADGFNYSRPMVEAAASGLIWTPENLSAYLENPRDFMRGTRMAFGGLRAEADRAAIIAYLQSIEP